MEYFQKKTWSNCAWSRFFWIPHRSTHYARYSVPGSIPGLTSSTFASVASNFSRNSPTIRGGGKNKKSKFSATYGIRTHA